MPENFNPDNLHPETILLRLIHPHWHKGKLVDLDLSAFNPSKEHGHQLSVWDGSILSPEEAFQKHTEEFGNLAFGVLCVSVKECLKEKLTVSRDKDQRPLYKGHILIDFRAHSKAERRKKAESLRKLANKRKWLWPPDLYEFS